jgi:hypothetical protein
VVEELERSEEGATTLGAESRTVTEDRDEVADMAALALSVDSVHDAAEGRDRSAATGSGTESAAASQGDGSTSVTVLADMTESTTPATTSSENAGSVAGATEAVTSSPA